MEEALAADIRRFWAHCLPSSMVISATPCKEFSFAACKEAWQQLGMQRIHCCGTIAVLGRVAFERLTELPVPSVPHHPLLLLYTLYFIYCSKPAAEPYQFSLEQIEFLQALGNESPLEARLFDRLWRAGAFAHIHVAPAHHPRPDMDSLLAKPAAHAGHPQAIHQIHDRLLQLKTVLEERPTGLDSACSPARRAALQRLRAVLEANYRGSKQMEPVFRLLEQIEAAVGAVQGSTHAATGPSRKPAKKAVAKAKAPSAALAFQSDDIVLDWTTGDIIELRERAASVPARLKQRRQAFSQELDQLASGGFFADMPKLQL